MADEQGAQQAWRRRGASPDPSERRGATLEPCFATTPNPSSPEEGTTLGVSPVAFERRGATSGEEWRSSLGISMADFFIE
jgi:hypothetical protein